jgi:hypothetical protein
VSRTLLRWLLPAIAIGLSIVPSVLSAGAPRPFAPGAGPDIAVSPESVSSTQAPGQATNHALTVANTGSADLEWAVADTPVSLAVDDGTAEDSFGNIVDNTSFAAIWLNRFTPAGGYPFRLEEIRILWPPEGEVSLRGRSFTLLVYTDTDGDGDPTDAALVYQQAAVVTVADGVTFGVYPLTSPVTLDGPGDVLIGFRDDWNLGGLNGDNYPAAFDAATSARRSWIAGNESDVAPDIANLDNNDFLALIDSFDYAGNWIIRGYGSAGPAGCTSPAAAAWLGASPTGGVAAPGGSTPLTVTIDSTGLAAGSYTAALCIDSNDPDPGPGSGTSRVIVPVTLTIPSPPAAPVVTASTSGGTIILTSPSAAGVTYTVWRSLAPYFTPGDAGSEARPGICTDDGTTVTCTDAGAAGHPEADYVYVLRASDVTGQHADSNRTGTSSFDLTAP